MIRACLSVTLVLAGYLVSHADDSSQAAASAAEHVDRLLEESWQRDGITPVGISGDAEFCRRVWLDLAGVAPGVAQLREFLGDTRQDKRQQLVDWLLRSPQYANHMASRWNEILLPPDAPAQRTQQENVAALHRWLRLRFRDNIPYDYLVGSFLTAGGAGDVGPAIFYTSHSLQPEKLAAATSRIFMGIQLQCAQCHDHPFDRWTQEDFWKYAAFFSQLQQSDPRGGREGIIEDRPGGELTLPESDQIMTPRYPGVMETPEEDPGNIRRRQLTIWMASRDNPYFARAAVNRAWGHLFGRGLVEPVDAMDADNRPSHPEVLDYLADFFIQQRFDLRTLYATLARTAAYGRTSMVASSDRPLEDSFGAMMVKTLTAEQFYDSLQQNVYRRSPPSPSDPSSQNRVTRGQFLARMRASGSSPRDYPHGIVQVLGLINGPEIRVSTAPKANGLIASLEAPFFTDNDRIETLFLATLSRMPRGEEADRFAAHLAAAKTSAQRRALMGDLLWVLLNTAECAVCP
jgi:hypothetical protein